MLQTFSGKIYSLPRELKVLIGVFLVVLSSGFFSALQFVSVTTEATPMGLQENYLGNEADLEAIDLKFRKNETQMLSILHTHILSMAIIFFILSLLLSLTSVRGFFRKFLLIEPLISVLLTFGGIFVLWKGILWMKYVVILSGGLMVFSFLASVVIIFRALLSKGQSRSA